MSLMDEAAKPYWLTSAELPPFPKLTHDTAADVVVVGAGITGLTSAYLLARAGKRVVVLERGRSVNAETAHTSAHVTLVTDMRLSELASRFGRYNAQAVWHAGLAAMDQMGQIIREHRIDADFAWIEGYLHPSPQADAAAEVEDLEDEVMLARDLGFDAEMVDEVPVVHLPGACFYGQARIHPRKYLAGVARELVALGGALFESSAAEEFVDDPRGVKANGHTVSCDAVVIATHNPMAGLAGGLSTTLLQTKLALYTTYVVAGAVPHGTVADALWWDTTDPYRYMRISPGTDHDLVILGGEDHKTGQETDTERCYRQLEERLAAMIPGIDLTYRWSCQVIETPDGLPYIGKNTEHQYVATGFAGNGLTFGTLAGMMIADAILGRRNPWSGLFDPGRKAIWHGAWAYIKENADYPYYLLRDRLTRAEARSFGTVKRGEGKVIELNGKRVAAYRDPNGVLAIRSAVCTHMGCVVAWNPAEHTWDCPCHGSRFTVKGDVISGPAQSPLPPLE